MNARRVASIALLVAAAALLAMAIVWRPGVPVSGQPETGIHVILVGIDALDWFLVSRYVEDGGMPTLERLLRSAVRAEVNPTSPPLPEAGWTALGRGRDLSPEERSGLEEAGDQRFFGMVPDVARIAEAADRTVLSIGWPASWPAPLSGPAVAAPYTPSAPSHELSVAPSFFVSGSGQASSPELAARIEAVVARNEGDAAAAFSKDVYDGPPPEDPVWEQHVTAARWGHLADRIVLDLAGGLIAEEEPDLALVYFGGLDAVQHRFLAPATPDYFPGFSTPPEYAPVVANYYGFVDAALRRLLRLADDRTLFIVCSVYGVHPASDVATITGSHADSPPGILIVRGPSLSAQDLAPTVATTDLAPTVLAALGVPVPTEMDGRILVGALPRWLVQRFPPSYQPGELPPPEPPGPAEPAAMDRLVSGRLRRLVDEASR